VGNVARGCVELFADFKDYGSQDVRIAEMREQALDLFNSRNCPPADSCAHDIEHSHSVKAGNLLAG
jgi:hypothetical protein